MNNWRLLLLALVAVFQPIASFTERNLIDGRQECCDNLSSTPLRDTRSSLHGTYRLGKTTSALRRLNDGNEIRHDQRNELRQRDPLFSRFSTEKSLVDIRERGARQGPFVTARSSRVEYRVERLVNDHIHGRLLNLNERERTARNLRDVKPQDQTHRVVDRNSRDGLERRDDRAYSQFSRDRLSRDDNRSDRINNERLSNNSFDSRRKNQREQIRSGELRFTPNRDARHVLRRTKVDVARIEASNFMNNLQHIARERLSVVRRESLVRADDTRRNMDNNNERRDLERKSEQRQSLSGNTRVADRSRDMRIRLNSWEENRENHHRISTNRRLSTERLEESRGQRDDRRESRQQNKENTNRRLFGERIQMTRRITRESRIMNEITTRNERHVDGRREIRNSKRMIRETPEETRENSDHRRERIQMHRSDIRESKIIDTQNKRGADGRREISHERMARETRDEIRENSARRLSGERTQMERRNIRDFRNVNIPNERNANIRKEVRYKDRVSVENRVEIGENSEHRLSSERIQLERRDIRELRIMNERDIASRREIKYKEKGSIETRENPDYRLSRETSQVNRRDTREFRNMNNVISQNERDVESQRVSRLPTSRENLDYRFSRKRIQIDRRHESRIVNTLNVRDLDTRQEIRFTERLFREVRDETRDRSDRILTRKSRQIDRRDLRESRISNGVNTRNGRDIDNRREIRLTSQIRFNQFTRESRMESRSPRRVMTEERENSLAERRARSVDRRNFREIRAEPKLSRSVDVQRSEVFRGRIEQSNKIENRKREAIDARSRNVELSRNRESVSSGFVGKMEAENDSIVGNWQYFLYTLQAAYLCALFMQMMTPSHPEKSHKMSLRWLPMSSHYNPIKVD